jgi:hypothetical protein
MRQGSFAMKTLSALVLMAASILLTAASAPAAGPFDGSMPLLCAVIDVMECGPGVECQRRSVESVNLPRFLLIDVAAQSMSAGDGSNRTAPIQRVERPDGRVILQGGQEGRAWSAVIAQDTGKLLAGVVDGQGAFVLFGACTAR